MKTILLIGYTTKELEQMNPALERFIEAENYENDLIILDKTIHFSGVKRTFFEGTDGMMENILITIYKEPFEEIEEQENRLDDLVPVYLTQIVLQECGEAKNEDELLKLINDKFFCFCVPLHFDSFVELIDGAIDTQDKILGYIEEEDYYHEWMEVPVIAA
jgi:rRNA pseudouridine-1189 N-methylase Emg1 (Nep1/Mra1 family)